MALTQRRAARRRAADRGGGIERFLPAIGGEQGSSLNLSRVAPALNAIDRAVPGLAQRVPPQKQQTLQAGLLALLGQPAELEGKRAIAVPVASTTARPRWGRFRWGKSRRRF